MANTTWQKIRDSDEHAGTAAEVCSSRLKVPGGWIVRSVVTQYGTNHGHSGVSVHQIFVPDKNHQWER